MYFILSTETEDLIHVLILVEYLVLYQMHRIWKN